jgi:uncharacterized protein (DUF1800 family)
MTLNRRDFNALALSAFAANLLNLRAASASPSASPASKILNRLTFGASPNAVSELERLGLAAWLDEQLALPASDEDLARRLSAAKLLIEYESDRDDKNRSWKARKEMIPYQHLSATASELLPLTDFGKYAMSYEERIRPAREVQAASLIRAVHAKAQVREVMTQFWHDHFSVNSMRDEHTAAYFVAYDRMMRENALGNFRALLGEMTRSPSMLFYLNNEASKASPANENFARELFELHTLGAENYFNDKTTNWSDVPGAKDGLAQGYIDQDVYEAARALTGWSFGDGRWLAEGDNAPLTGEFHYVDRWHDPYQKRILGVEFRANQGPMEDGEKLLDILAGHPGTARFVCTKICRRLLSDEPPASLIDKAVSVWTENQQAPDQIAKVVRTIALSGEFAAAEPRKLKRPFEFLASLYRATEAEVASPTLNFHWDLSKCGWNQHECRPPTGHADVSGHWANTNLVAGYTQLAVNALEDGFEAGKANLSGPLPENATTLQEAARYWSVRLQSGEPSGETLAATRAMFSDDPAASLSDDPNDREWALRQIVAMAALSPQFLFR